MKDFEGKNEKIPTEMRDESKIPGNMGKTDRKNLVIFILKCLKGCLEQYTEYQKVSTYRKIFWFCFSLNEMFFPYLNAIQK